MKKPEINKQIPKALIPMIRDTFQEIVQSEIAYAKEEQIKPQISSFTMNDILADLVKKI